MLLSTIEYHLPPIIVVVKSLIKAKKNHLDQLYAAFPSDNSPSFPVETVAFSKCLIFVDDREDVTIINIDNQSFRNS